MKKRDLLCLSASLLALGVASQASAADMVVPAYSPVYSKARPLVRVNDWSGAYVGINGGYADSRFALRGTLASGGTFGAQAGYRWQLSNVVLGLEAQGNWADLNKSTHESSTALTSVSGILNQNTVDTRIRTNAFGLFTGQIGYAFNNLLIYAKGGGAVVKSSATQTNNNWFSSAGVNQFPIYSWSYTFNPAALELNERGSTYYYPLCPTNSTTSASQMRWGGVVGAGLEYGLSPNWSLGVEYDRVFLPANRNFARQNLDLGLLRLNYKLGGPVFAAGY